MEESGVIVIVKCKIERFFLIESDDLKKDESYGVKNGGQGVTNEIALYEGSS